jgi:uncharacterized glyoxalase superfamily protein PhnB
VIVMSNRDDHSIWPGLTYRDAHAARSWLAAIGFTEGIVVPGTGPDEIMHSEMIWPEGGRVMVHTACREGGEAAFDAPLGSGSCYVVTADPDKVHALAGDLGAEIVRELEDTDYGSRGFSVRDAEGNIWSFGTYAGTEA